MVIEITPQPGVSPCFDLQSNSGQFCGKQTHRSLGPDTGTDPDAAHNIKVKLIAIGRQINSITLRLLFLDRQGEGMALEVFVLEGHAEGHVQVCGNHEIHLQTVSQDVKRVYCATQIDKVDDDQIYPILVCILHKRRILLGQAAAGGSLRLRKNRLNLFHFFLNGFA